MTTTDDNDFALSQYADGTLPAGDRSAVEQRLAVDPAARAALMEYRRLGELLAAAPAGIDWDALAGRLSAAVVADDQPAVAGRIGFGRRVGLAVAAAVALFVGARLLLPQATVTPPATSIPREQAKVTPSAEPPRPAVAVVSGPAVEAGGGAAVAEVKVGPSPALAARQGSWRYAEGVVGRPSTAVITSARGVPGHGWPR